MAEKIYSMKTRLVLLLLIFSASLFAAPKDTARVSHKLYFEAGGCLDYSYRFLKTNDTQMDALVKARNETESPITGYSIGLTFIKPLNNKIDFSFGFGLAVHGYKRDPYEIIQNGDSVGTMDLVRRLNYFQAPLELRYHFNRSFYFMLGASPDIFVAEHFTYHIHYDTGRKETQHGSIKGYSLLNPEALTGFGFTMPVGGGMICIQPVFRCSLAPVVSAPVKEYLYSGGLYIGLDF